MALQPSSPFLTNREMLDKLFNDIQCKLQEQKKLLLEQTNEETTIMINQQKYNNIIDSLKEIVTTSSNNHASSIKEIKSIPSKKEKHVTVNIDNYTMDQLSIWIKNKQLWQYIDKQNMDKIQTDIINNVFGGFDKFMQYILENKWKTSTLQKNKLYNILLNYSSSSHDIFHNYHPRDDGKITIASIPDQCLSYIMKFLTQNNRYIAQETCRLFAIAIRQEGAVNNMEKDFKCMDMIPNIKTMIQNIQSDDEDLNRKGLELFANYMKDNRWILRNKIRNFDKTIWEKFEKLVLSNDSELNMKIGLFLINNELSHEMLEIVIKYLQNLEKYKDIDEEKSGTRLASIVQSMRYSMYKVFHHKKLIPTLLQMVRETDSYQFRDKHVKQEFIGDVYHCIGKIAKFGLLKYNRQLIDQGFMENVKNMLSLMELDDYISDYESEGIWSALIGFLDTPGCIEIEEMFEGTNSDILQKAIKYPDSSAAFLIKIFRNCTHQRRMKLIQQLSEKGRSLNKRKYQNVLDALKDIGDMEAYNKFEKDISMNSPYSYWDNF